MADVASLTLAKLFLALAEVYDNVETEIATLQEFDDALRERMERDIKAAAYDRINHLVDEVLPKK